MIVTLTTDFGQRDGYVAAMKGAMLSAKPDIRMVDVSHHIPAQDMMEAAFVLRQVIPYYPAETVHLVVVDPGVGTQRRAIAARFAMDGKTHRFVGPDNGILPLLAGESIGEIVQLDRSDIWFDASPSRTCHGRDGFGPVAARLAAGARLVEVGTLIESVSAMHWPLPRIDDQAIDGMVLHVDTFGNCITNITADDLDDRRDGRSFKCYAGSTVIQAHQATYAEVSAGDPITLIGSTGLLEIAVNCGHAADLLSIQRGASVNVVFGSASREARADAAVTEIG